MTKLGELSFALIEQTIAQTSDSSEQGFFETRSIPRTGEFGTLMLIALPFLCACTAMGFAIALIIPWREGVVFFLVVMGVPLFFLSGIAWPIESIPDKLRVISLLVPSSSAISAFVAVNQMGATPQDIAGAVQLQIALAFGYTLIAMLIYRFTKTRQNQHA
ncbi:ABC transporter permease [Marivita sp. S2033]|uniref:ABC transporter permease n=1 Tax=Marivita sp. S2033 TaxID=3373187 RepID=UPI003981E446